MKNRRKKPKLPNKLKRQKLLSKPRKRTRIKVRNEEVAVSVVVKIFIIRIKTKQKRKLYSIKTSPLTMLST